LKFPRMMAAILSSKFSSENDISHNENGNAQMEKGQEQQFSCGRVCWSLGYESKNFQLKATVAIGCCIT